jgi:Chaperone of endosialidase
MKAIALAARSPISHSCFRCSLLLMPAVFLLVCFALCQMARAVSPAPDGGYPNNNTAEGTSALSSLTSGADNTAIGFQALFSNTSGTYNSGEGFRALFSNTTGVLNTATGVQALNSNTIGAQNTATGVNALFSNTTASYNTANGTSALFHNTIGSQNTATGVNALTNNTTGAQNTATGVNALYRNTTGNSNTGIGVQALFNNTTGPFNTAVGFEALMNATNNANAAVGDLALQNVSTGFFNTAIGAATGINQTTGNNNIYIGQGSAGVAGESNTCYIQEIYTNIQPIVGVNPDYVTVNSSGKLGRANVSSRRYKHDIEPMHKASEKLYALKPVSFRYNKEYDATQTIAFGLIAEDVAQVYPDLVGRNPDGQPESVRYEQINAMLLNEFLKEHKKVEEQQANIAELKSTVAQQQKGMQVLTAQLKEQAAQIQKVSAQLEVSKPGPETVASNK